MKTKEVITGIVVKRLSTILIAKFAALKSQSAEVEKECKTISDQIKVLMQDAGAQTTDDPVKHSTVKSQTHPNEETDIYTYGPANSPQQLVLTDYPQAKIDWQEEAKTFFIALTMNLGKDRFEAEKIWNAHVDELAKAAMIRTVKLEIKPNPNFDLKTALHKKKKGA